MRTFAGHVVEDAVKLHVLPGGLVLVEAGVLEDDAEAAAHFLLLVHGVEAVHADAAAGGPQQRGEHFDGGGFAGSVGAEEGEDLPRADFERDVVDRHHVTELANEVLDVNCWAGLGHGQAYPADGARSMWGSIIQAGPPAGGRAFSRLPRSALARTSCSPLPYELVLRHRLLHSILAAAALVLGAAPAFAQISRAEIAERRAALARAMGEGTLVVTAAAEGDISRNGYVPNQNFLYLTGLSDLMERWSSARREEWRRHSCSSPTRCPLARCGRVTGSASTERARRRDFPAALEAASPPRCSRCSDRTTRCTSRTTPPAASQPANCCTSCARRTARSEHATRHR